MDSQRILIAGYNTVVTVDGINHVDYFQKCFEKYDMRFFLWVVLNADIISQDT